MSMPADGVAFWMVYPESGGHARGHPQPRRRVQVAWHAASGLKHELVKGLRRDHHTRGRGLRRQGRADVSRQHRRPLLGRRHREGTGEPPRSRTTRLPRRSSASQPRQQFTKPSAAISRTSPDIIGRLKPDQLPESASMKTRRIGSLSVSVVGLGCNNFGMTIDEKQSAEVVHAALDAGHQLLRHGGHVRRNQQRTVSRPARWRSGATRRSSPPNSACA